MRKFIAIKRSNNHIRTELHLEFGDFRRVERALEFAECGRYEVSLDDQTGSTFSRKIKVRTKVVHNNESEEYIVKVWYDGKRRVEADYFTSDKEDAVVTAAYMEIN